MLFANVCAAFISSCYGEFGKWRFFGFLASLRCHCAFFGVLALLVYLLWVVQGLGMFRFVLCLRQGWHAICQRVRRVHQFLLWGIL